MYLRSNRPDAVDANEFDVPIFRQRPESWSAVAPREQRDGSSATLVDLVDQPLESIDVRPRSKRIRANPRGTPTDNSERKTSVHLRFILTARTGAPYRRGTSNCVCWHLAQPSVM